MKKDSLYIAVIVLVALLGMSIIGNVWQHYHFREAAQMVRTDTVTNTVYVERTDTAPRLTTERVIERVGISDILNPNKQCNEDTLQVECEVTDSRDLSLPVVQKTYQDSAYTAYVSGIQYQDLPRLDSIRIRERIVYQTVTMTKEARKKRWSVGVTGGYGYGFTSKQVEPYIGIGVSYSMFTF